MPPAATRLRADEKNAVAVIKKPFQPRNDAVAFSAFIRVERRVLPDDTVPRLNQPVVGASEAGFRRHEAFVEPGGGDIEIEGKLDPGPRLAGWIEEGWRRQPLVGLRDRGF